MTIEKWVDEFRVISKSNIELQTAAYFMDMGLTPHAATIQTAINEEQFFNSIELEV